MKHLIPKVTINISHTNGSFSLTKDEIYSCEPGEVSGYTKVYSVVEIGGHVLAGTYSAPVPVILNWIHIPNSMIIDYFYTLQEIRKKKLIKLNNINEKG